MPQAEDRVLGGCPPRSPRQPQTLVTGLSPRLRFRPTGYRGEAPTPSSLDLINLLEQPTDLGETFRRHDCGLAMKGYNPGRDTGGQVRARGAMPSPGPPLPQSPRVHQPGFCGGFRMSARSITTLTLGVDSTSSLSPLPGGQEVGRKVPVTDSVPSATSSHP